MPFGLFITPPNRSSICRSSRANALPLGQSEAPPDKLGLAGVSESTATFLPLAGVAAVEAMNDRKVDVAWIFGPPQAPAVQAALQNPDVRLLSFSTAEAYTRLYPDLVRLTLPQGVFDI